MMLRSPEFQRVISNYLRMLCTFVMGLLIVRLLIALSDEVFSTYTLITIGVGVGIMLKELARIGLVPYLSKSLNDGDERFAQKLGISVAVTSMLGLFGLFCMWVFALNLEHFAIQKNQTTAVLVFIVCRAIQIFVSLFCMPHIALLTITRRYVSSNVFLTLERLADLLAVICAIVFVNPNEGGEVLVLVGIVSLALTTILYIGTAWLVFNLNTKFRPSFSDLSIVQLRPIFSLFGWASILVLASNLFLRFDTLFVNIKDGVIGTVIFGITVQAIGLIRQLTFGLVAGLDAAFAHQKNNKVDGDGSYALLRISSYLQASIGFAVYGVLFFCGSTVLELWIGSENADSFMLSQAIQLVVVMGLGIIVTGFAEVWISIMNGQGLIGRYAPWLVPGAILNPILLFVGYKIMDQYPAYWHAAILYTVLQTVTYGVFVLSATSRATLIPISKMILPFVIPLLLNLSAAILFYVGVSFLGEISKLEELFVCLVIFGCAGALSLANLYFGYWSVDEYFA